MMTLKNKPTYYDRFIIWCITNVKRVNYVIGEGMTEAYELGYKEGLAEGSKMNGKKYQKKVKKALNRMYKRPKAKA